MISYSAMKIAAQSGKFAIYHAQYSTGAAIAAISPSLPVLQALALGADYDDFKATIASTEVVSIDDAIALVPLGLVPPVPPSA